VKPAHRTVSYVVYSPGYVPGIGKYKRARNIKAAFRICRQFGVGSEVMRNFEKRNRKGGGSSYSDPREWVYNGEHPKPIPQFTTSGTFPSNQEK
jgi:hypothetical protein